jgi:crossover junction endodeoxyribonuclease RuvC
MRVIGIDPGLRRTGWGVIQIDGNQLKHVGNGVCNSTASEELSVRLLEIFVQLRAVIARYKPDCAAVENTFVSKDAAGTLKLGQARGIALLAPAEAGLRVYEYAPNKVKKTVVGVGHADKAQIEHMVKMQLPGVTLQGSDAADALGIALCHAFQGKYDERINVALSKGGVR